MKYLSKPIFLLASSLLLAGCSSPATSSNSVSTSSSASTSITSGSATSSSGSSSSAEIDFDNLETLYGDFSIVGADGNSLYTKDGNVYTLIVSNSSKAEYTLKGYFDGQIKIANPNNLSEFKGVVINLDGACLTNYENGEGAVIDFTLESKNVEIKAKKDSTNKIISMNEYAAIASSNNIEINGGGALELSSYGIDAHTIEADGDIRIYGATTITIPYSAHDAFHGKKLDFVNDSDVAFSGSVTVERAASQAFDFETNKGKGYIAVQGGTINVSYAASVFKTDASLTISSGAVITASNLSEDPVVAGEYSSGLVYSCEGSFTVDGEDYSYNG